MGLEEKSRHLIFTYGTLKRGFPNHPLMEELIGSGDAAFLGTYRTVEKYPLVCGPFRVPFLLNIPGSGNRVWGELYAVSNRSLVFMDELEGTSNGHYERLAIDIEEAEGESKLKAAQAYFGHRSYAEEMWRCSGEKGCERYTEEEANGYVRRKDRPQNSLFLEHIRAFVSSPPAGLK